jgi:hypothetical protein
MGSRRRLMFHLGRGPCLWKTTAAWLRREREKKLLMMIFRLFALRMKKPQGTARTNPIPKPISAKV